jgi:hypothetical protein
VVLATCAALVLTGLGFWMGQVAYRQAKGWKTFYEYNILRLRLAEYISPERTNPETAARLAKEVGWSANDFALFRNWFFTDPDLFSLHRVQQAVNLFYGTTSEPPDGWRKARLERSLDVGTTFFRETRWAILLLGVFVLAQGLRPKLVIYFVGTVLTLGLLVMGINLTMKAPPLRIFWPMLIMAATTLTLATQRWGRPVHWSINCAAILTAICVVGIAQPSMKDESERRRQAAEVATADVESLRRTGATMYILHGNAFPYEDFWSPLQTKTAAFDFVGLGVSARTPPVQEFLARTGMTDLPFSLCTQSGMVFVAHPYMIPMLTTFLSEHRGMTVEFIEAYKGRRILAWRCRQKSGEPERPV